MEQLDAVRADRRSDLSKEQERQILERLIDEELLIQNALETGFANSDRSVRSTIVQRGGFIDPGGSKNQTTNRNRAEKIPCRQYPALYAGG